MCDLIAANKCHAAVEPHLDEWTADYPGCAVLVYMDGGKVKVRIVSSFAAAERVQESLSDQQRAGSVIVDLPARDRAMML